VHDTIPRRERFVFPDGSVVEILVFACSAGNAAVTRWEARVEGRGRPRPPKPDAPQADGARLAAAPTVCSRCGSTFVYPVDWERNREGGWNIRMRCPNCESQTRIVLAREAVEDLNRTLYQQTRTLARQADTLSRRNFEEEAEKLVRALARDLILPMDF
jgi:hypothetical protein